MSRNDRPVLEIVDQFHVTSSRISGTAGIERVEAKSTGFFAQASDRVHASAAENFRSRARFSTVSARATPLISSIRCPP